MNNTLCDQQFSSPFQSLLFLLVAEFLRHIDLIEVTRIENLASRKHVVNGGENHPCDSDNGSFFSSSFGDTLILDSVVRVIFRFDSSMSDLHKSRFEVNTGSCDANRLFLPVDSLLLGVRPAQQQSRFEDEK